MVTEIILVILVVVSWLGLVAALRSRQRLRRALSAAQAHEHRTEMPTAPERIPESAPTRPSEDSTADLQAAKEHLEHEIIERQRAELALRQAGEQLRATFDAISDWVSVVDADLRIVMANEAFRQITREYGLSSEPLGRTPLELFPFLPSQVHEEYHQVFETSRPLITVETSRAGSVEVITETRKVPIIENGRVTRVITIMRDLTGQKQAEKTLRVTEARRQAMLNALPDLMFRLSRANVFLDYHAPHPEDLLQPPEVFLGKTVSEVLPPDVAPAVLDIIEQARRTGHVQAARFPLVLQDASRYFEARAVIDGDDEALVIVRNITDLVQSEERALQLGLEKERSAILAGFVQDVSHEFANPLSVIKNDLYLIAHETDPGKKQRRLDGIGGQVFHIERLVKGLLTMTQLDRFISLVCEPLDLNSMAQSVVDSLSSSVQNKNHTVTLDLAPALPVVIADPRLLGQAFSELLRNAILFTPPGGQITLSTRQQAAWAVIEFRDSGIGISADDLPHVFERFFRVDKARGERGAGLGLTIAQKIVEEHQGRIEAESTPGIGSTFRVFLPIPRS